jgi:DNA polymerase I
MDFELHPAITLGFRAFHVLVAPVQMLVEALNSHLNLQRFEVLYVCGNYSRILSGLDRRFTALEVRRAFTAFQLMTILEENRHTLLILEHDPLEAAIFSVLIELLREREDSSTSVNSTIDKK